MSDDSSSIVFVGAVTADQAKAVQYLEQTLSRPVQPILLYSSDVDEPPMAPPEVAGQLLAYAVDFTDPADVAQALAPYAGSIIAVACKDDESAANLRHLALFLPGVPLPSAHALLASTDKMLMRSKLHAYDAALSPKFTLVADDSPEAIQLTEQTVGYPLIVKPASLTSSLLVAACYNRAQLTEALQHIARYAAENGLARPRVLAEQLMEEGAYYSIDAYVDGRGAMEFTPPVHYKTGRDIGFDDFFGYLRTTDTGLTAEQIAGCERAATAAIKALELTSTTCHVELMLTPEGWKIIEVGPRLGGFRHELYHKAFGINHALNDLLIRSGRAPVIPKTQLGYAAALQFYARSEGTLQEIKGLEIVRGLRSLQRLAVFKTPGQACTFAKHGGSPVLEVVLFSKQQAALQADIDRIEAALRIETEPVAPLSQSPSISRRNRHVESL